MKKNTFLYWFQGKTGRLVIASLPVLFLIIFGFDFLKSGNRTFYFFLSYGLTLSFLLYKIWSFYYAFAALYRKKVNPNFPLTNTETAEFIVENPNIAYQLFGFRQFGLVWKDYKDKELAVSAKKIRIYTIIAFSSPIIWFFTIVAFSIIFG